MILNKEKCKISITELLLLVLSVVFLIGIRSWFSVCPVNGDTVMSCHWAGEMLKALSILFVVTAVIRLVLPDPKLKLGMDIPLFCLYLLTAFLPGGIIRLCQNTEMVCRQSTSLWTILLSAVLLAVTLADILFYASFLSGQKHHRKETK